MDAGRFAGLKVRVKEIAAMMKERRLVSAAVVFGLLGGGARMSGAQLVAPQDHLVCAKLRDSVPRASYTARLGPSAQDELVGCVIKLPPRLACQSTSKTAVTPPPPGGGPIGALSHAKMLCYKVRCPTAPNTFGTVRDQFGIHNVTLGPSRLLCAPASPGGAFLEGAGLLL
jgi:hypothetical protein